jgi:menaquinone-dependent protoporphyrinogen oxidase
VKPAALAGLAAGVAIPAYGVYCRYRRDMNAARARLAAVTADAVVFGSGVYDGSWTAEATELMRRHAVVLARKPLWLFSVGSFSDQHPIVGGLIKKEPKEISEFEHTLHPRDYRVFAGVIDLDHWPAWGRLLVKALGGHAGDNRQWPDIDAWAEEIAHELRAQD